MKNTLLVVALFGPIMLAPTARAQTPSPTPSPGVTDFPNLGLERFPTITCSACHAHSPRPPRAHLVRRAPRPRIQLAQTGSTRPLLLGLTLLLFGLVIRRYALAR